MSAVRKEQSNSDAPWTPVCAIDDIVPDMGAAVLVGGQQIAVFRVTAGDGEQLYALGNRDPFSDANVLSRGIVGDLGGELVVASPVYKQHFSLSSGRCLEDAEVSVPVYEVRLIDGVVQVAA